ncbi:3-hydroxyacyl-CoA dehydrogenase NAD-binding domain-containing protein [Rhodopila sp.]|jgi:3-hydroxyacyl-CoA dehydrogenase|uniref:3-hydroxyacyl-CoA dehydrogenase NAD-binding domain-containing protein n=1 Tax=Rhodopila sp. TaxID=2480087 RepID=UPI002C558BCB|nr:3-hydroxyacyl-CoA dehydrogenase NAD-binding domain-containing protein [Rhodopila sp.]HVZ10638.1 3-hydroxyacyl-CoA dehydrogenase NAD-binding domain-containing protein [Rhodopila sp.]
MTLPTAVKRVAVLGAGTIGASWVAWFLAKGLQVDIWDPKPEAEAYVRRSITDAWPAMSALGMAADASPDAWRFHPSPEDAVAAADFVQENAPERLPVKRALYGRIDMALRPDAILGSSTSGLIMSEMQAGFRSAPRLAVGHPFNPPHLIPLVEVVGGRETAPETIAWCLEFYRHIGKKPIHIRKEARGHLANRLQAALWREAVSAVVTGLASVEDVDTAISAGPGLRWAAMGPHMTFHLGGGEGGIEHLLAQFKPAFESWWETMSTPELNEENCRKIIDGVRAEAAGRSMAELVRERDAILLPLLALVSGKP